MSEKKIIGLIRPFDFPHMDVTVNHLADAVDEIYYFCDRKIDPDVYKFITGHPKTAEIKKSIDVWSNGSALQSAFDWLVELNINPDVILYPDEDEMLPGDREHIVQRLYENKEPSCVLLFPFLNCYNDIGTVIVNWIDYPHAKAMKFKDAPIFLKDNDPRSYLGFCCPRNYTYIYDKYPLRHLTVMTDECRKRRIKHSKCRHAHGDLGADYKPHDIVDFNQYLTIDEWKTLFAKYPEYDTP